MEKVLSIFIDESGDFGKVCEHCPYYIVSLVFHEQINSISTQVDKLNNSLVELNLENHTIHTAPLIRREAVYSDYDLLDRRRILNKLMKFMSSVNISYSTLTVDKHYYKNQIDISKQLGFQLSTLIKNNLAYFQSFDKIVVYYDNGQYQLTNILATAFGIFFNDEYCEFKVPQHYTYKLFQVADLICTIELIKTKLLSGKRLTQSEKKFFASENKFKRKYVQIIEKLKL